MMGNFKNFENTDFGCDEINIVYVVEHAIQKGTSSLVLSCDWGKQFYFFVSSPFLLQ
jgi:hypothetical protein